MNYITKRTIRYGILMQFSFFVSFLLFMGSVLLATAFEDKTYWILPLLAMVFTVPLTLDLNKKIKIQKFYRDEIITFIAVIKPLKGKNYSEIINTIGFESETTYETINYRKLVIREWYALGYTFKAVFDDGDNILDYSEINAYKRK